MPMLYSIPCCPLKYGYVKTKFGMIMSKSSLHYSTYVVCVKVGDLGPQEGSKRLSSHSSKLPPVVSHRFIRVGDTNILTAKIFFYS